MSVLHTAARAAPDGGGNRRAFPKNAKKKPHRNGLGDDTFLVQPSSLKHDKIKLPIKNNKLPTTVSSSVHVYTAISITNCCIHS